MEILKDYSKKRFIEKLKIKSFMTKNPFMVEENNLFRYTKNE